MDFFVPFDQLGQSVPGPWKNANPNAGQRGSILNALVFPAVQGELLAIQDEVGFARDVNNNAQILQALRSGKLNTFADTGTADAIVVQPLSAFISVFLGTEISFLKGASDNATTAPTLTIGAGSVHTGSAITHPIVKQDGTALAAGDLKAGSLIKVKYDGLNNFRVITPTRSEFAASSSFVSNLITNFPSISPARNLQAFLVHGTYTWTVPANVTWIYVQVVGAGGGGAGGSGGATWSSGGGASGGFTASWIAVTPGQVFTVVVGAGGAGASNADGATGGTGGTSSFGSSMTGTGGFGGIGSSAAPAGGNPGAGSGGQLNFAGSFGGDGNSYNVHTQGGAGGASAFGGGGRTSTTANGAMNGQAPGSGGAGVWDNRFPTTPQIGGNGADGAVLIQY